jgi:Autotransporter beta-domain/Autochaperone Domain Type 1
VGRRYKPVAPPSARRRRRAGLIAGRQAGAQAPQPQVRLRAPSRHALLLGTALASTLLLATLAAPTPAHAVVACPPGTFPPPGPITLNPAGDSVNCVNVYDRNNAGDPVIDLLTIGAGQFISLNNSGDLTSPDDRGIRAYSQGANSPVDVFNTGDIDSYRSSIYAKTKFGALEVFNAGHITTEYLGIQAATGNAGGPNSPLTLTNTGDIDQNVGTAISASTYQAQSELTLVNSGALTGATYGITARTFADDSPIGVTNSGDIRTFDDPANFNFRATGISTYAGGANSPTTITNSGSLWSVSSYAAYGISAGSGDPDSPITIHNSGDIHAIGAGPYSYAYGIQAVTYDDGSPITIVNSADLRVVQSGPGGYAFGISAATFDLGSGISIQNTADIMVTGKAAAVGIDVYSSNEPITIVNAGSVYAKGRYSVGIYASSGSKTTITNTGEIGASSNLAIAVTDGAVDIFNAGIITGYVLLDEDDRFVNQAGGVFEAREISDFDFYGVGGNDLFRNEAGATVHATGDVAFVNLERFENRGLISMVDGQAGDEFVIFNTYGGSNLSFAASGNSTLAVDAFLAGPGNSDSDRFGIDGDVSGRTKVVVNNTNYGPGVFNPQGIEVVAVSGATPSENAFYLEQSIDTGFFNYDLFFTPTGSGFWELRSFAGPGAFLLPQLVTAAQDIWHQSASTWFDRTADLRVLLNGGASPAAYDPGGKSLGAAGPYPLTPAVWARGSGGWLDRDGTQRTTAYGRDYSFDMDRDLETIDFQVGVDMGKRDVLTGGDALVFGLLGGFVHGDLDYDALARQFNFDGGQVGAYANYLNGGLFVDTLLNVHLYSLDTNTLGFPDSLDANTVGLRTDTGYRFGSFSGGPFIEPLATIEVTWADIDGFSLGGNTVSFGDDANVRGRLGLRAGTTTEVWDSTLMEPFVTGSLWGNLTDDNSATLVSTGRTFRFEDQLQDVWGEISAGVNFFNFSQTTAVFAKVDVTFGDDLTGLGGKAGMRVSW